MPRWFRYGHSYQSILGGGRDSDSSDRREKENAPVKDKRASICLAQPTMNMDELITAKKKRARLSMLPKIDIPRPLEAKPRQQKEIPIPQPRSHVVVGPAGKLSGSWHIDTKRPETWVTTEGATEHFSIRSLGPVNLKINLRGGNEMAKLYICSKSNDDCLIEVMNPGRQKFDMMCLLGVGISGARSCSICCALPYFCIETSSSGINCIVPLSYRGAVVVVGRLAPSFSPELLPRITTTYATETRTKTLLSGTPIGPEQTHDTLRVSFDIYSVHLSDWRPTRDQWGYALSRAACAVSPRIHLNNIFMRHDGRISGSWRIDTSLELPSSLLGSVGEHLGHHVYLRTQNAIDAEVDLVGGTEVARVLVNAGWSEGAQLLLVNPRRQKFSASVYVGDEGYQPVGCKIVSHMPTLKCIVTNERVYLSLPRTFEGVLQINGSPELETTTSIFPRLTNASSDFGKSKYLISPASSSSLPSSRRYSTSSHAGCRNQNKIIVDIPRGGTVILSETPVTEHNLIYKALDIPLGNIDS